MSFKEGFYNQANEVDNFAENKSSFDPDRKLSRTEQMEINDVEKNAEYDPDKRIAVIEPHEDGLYTSVADRIKGTNRDLSEGGLRGCWNGERGNSIFKPSYEYMKNRLAEYGKEGVEFKNGVVDFSPFSKASVEIDHMTADRGENFRQADIKLAEKFSAENRDGKSNWTPRDVNDYIQANKLTRHECSDMKTIELIPTSIHDYFGHYGGVAECKIRDGVKGGNFDE